MRYEIEVNHDRLNRSRVIVANDPHVLQRKAEAQQSTWEADAVLREIEDALAAALRSDHRIDWERLKDFSQFTRPRPQQPRPSLAGSRPERLKPLEVPEEPRIDDPKYVDRALRVRRLSIRELFSPTSEIRERRMELITALHAADCEEWTKLVRTTERANAEREREYAERLRKWEVDNEGLRRRAEQQYAQDLSSWERERDEFLLWRRRKNEPIDEQEQQYLNKRESAVGRYCRMVLKNSKYPDSFPREYDLRYVPTTRTLIVDYCLPSPQDLPSLKEVKYVQSSDELKEIHLSESAVSKMYDDLLYKIALRSIYELYQTDVAEALDSIVFNGWVDSVDKSTGKEVRPCVLSVQAGREEFLAINLAQVDPKACFRKLKGVAASKLHALSAVPPIVTIDREDARFVAARGVAGSLDGSENLAAIDWQDFEQLVRELFEKEFAQGGGEVNVTRASRDYGVDAIAFDPDPIRGGKIAIQAKRYTNVVGVAAVRDLYGTVINEGATKGILITTADYGPEAYEFAKGKPLTLLNGGHLLHLLDKHGHKARIDMQEAKRILAEREK